MFRPPFSEYQMQHPLITDEMKRELDNEVARLAPDEQDVHDPIGKSPFVPRLRRRDANLQDSGSVAQGSQNDPQAIPEDPINPAHYRKNASGIECIEVTRHMNFNVGNAMKYIWRYEHKGDPIETLKKAQWYLNDEIVRLEKMRDR